jgi:hypothetical protein
MGKLDLGIGVLHDIFYYPMYFPIFECSQGSNPSEQHFMFILTRPGQDRILPHTHPSASGTTTWLSRESQDQDPQLLQITTVKTPYKAVSSGSTLNATPSNLPLPSRLASTDLWGLEHRLKQSLTQPSLQTSPAATTIF